MARTVDAAQLTLANQGVYRPFLLCDLELDSGTIYVCTLDKNISWSGNLYLGVGDFGTVTPSRETSEAEASGISMELTGIPSDYIDIAQNENYHGRVVIIRYGLLGENNELTATTGDPSILFRGFIDQMFISLGKEATVRLTAEDDWIRWEEPIKSLYTNEEQQFLYAGDLGLEFVQQTTNKELIWGRS